MSPSPCPVGQADLSNPSPSRPKMALHRVLTPALVICAPCREKHDYSDRLSSLVEDEDSGTVLVREVCTAVDCPELQLRGYLCADHILDFELAWEHQIPVRACHSCKRSTLQLSIEQHDVWFILTPSDEAKCIRGVESRFLDKSRLEASRLLEFQSPVRVKGKGRKQRTSSVKKRRSARTLRQLRDRERLLAMEWSLGNIQVKQLFLWKDNKRRLDAENSTTNAETSNAMEKVKPEHAETDAVRARPEPTTALCVVPKCRSFAKTGDRCLFHASIPISRLPKPRPASKDPPTTSAHSMLTQRSTAPPSAP